VGINQAPAKFWGVSLGCRRLGSFNLVYVQIIVEISAGKDGRATGTVRAAGEGQACPFSGNLEFLALIESLYQVGTESAGQQISSTDKESS
jgi:hypothetical protein